MYGMCEFEKKNEEETSALWMVGEEKVTYLFIWKTHELSVAYSILDLFFTQTHYQVINPFPPLNPLDGRKV